MSTTQPIRNGEDVQKLLNYYEQEKPNLRNYTLIICGLHTALRISDLLSLRWENVYDFKKQRYVTCMCMKKRLENTVCLPSITM